MEALSEAISLLGWPILTWWSGCLSFSL